MGCGASKTLPESLETLKPTPDDPGTQNISDRRLDLVPQKDSEPVKEDVEREPPAFAISEVTDSGQQNDDVNMFDVMISFSDEDKKVASDIYDVLSQRLSGWMCRDMGSYNSDEILLSMVNSRVIVPLLSVAYEGSRRCKQELNFADSRKCPIVPVRLDRGPFTWTDLITAGNVYVDFSDSSSDQWYEKIEKLCDEIRARISHKSHALTTSTVKRTTRRGSELVGENGAWLDSEKLKMEEELKELLMHRMDGTRAWVISDIHRLLNGASPIYWLYAEDGFGKTTIVASAIWQLRTEATIGLVFKSLILDPFINLPDSSTPIVILLDQINSVGALGNDDRLDFLEILSQWSSHPPFLKLFISSHPQDDIDHILGRQDVKEFGNPVVLRELNLSDVNHTKDLSLYAIRKLKQIQHRLKKTDAELETVSFKLIRSLNGHFKDLVDACEDVRKSIAPGAVLDKIIFG
ncbi:hypothetical protein HDU67_009287 [Dinochytrium kinnereticum]|nr:hypothetical protein HDU67_009287 [Dinochytrium kinnereticum]